MRAWILRMVTRLVYGVCSVVLTSTRHHMMCLAFDNKLFLAPLENPQTALDVGTGTGIWAM